MGQLLVLSKRWFPEEEPSTESMGRALYLENEYWERMTTAITNGIAKAFNGQ